MLVLRTIRECYPKAWGRYGFVDAFNPLTGWYDPDVLGIGLGITMLMAENHRSGLVWNTFMKNAEAQFAMQKVGFQSKHYNNSFRSTFEERDYLIPDPSTIVM